MSLRTRKGDLTTSTYDAMNRLLTKTPAGQGTVTYGYNLLSEPLSISEAASGSNAAYTTSYDYDAAGRKRFEQTTPIAGAARQVNYQYDNAGNRTVTQWPDGYFINYQYDALNRMQYVRENSTSVNELAFYDYDMLGRRKTLCLGGQSTSCLANGGTNKTTYSYELDNNLNLLTQVMNGTTLVLDYDHNRSGQITRLGANDDFYLVKPKVATSVAYVPNKLNQYSSVKGQAATYDLNGNLLTGYPTDGSGKDTYTYDSENRLLTAAVNGATTATISYDYDALGRRMKKTVNGTTTHYLLDGDEEIAEYDNAGTVLRRYITGPAIDDRIARAEGSATTNPTKYYYHVNHQGSVIDLTNAAGSIQQKLAYDEYGNLTSDSGAVTTGEQFRYTGRRYDPETNLYYYRARYYSPDLGRFLQVDPIGYQDDFNLYAYVGNDPLDKTDPSGHYGMGAGWTDETWQKFNEIQQKAANDMEKRAGKLEQKAGKLDEKGKAGGDKLRGQANSLRQGASALRSDGSDGKVANAVDSKTYQSMGGSANGAAFVKDNGPVMTVNTGNANAWKSGNTMSQWVVGHESLHTAGLNDQVGSNGKTAYKFGDPNQRASFRELQGTDKGYINPDHVMNTVYPFLEP